ncbi:MAG: photosystem I assembly protein Ycf3 [Syntrophorhabdus sp. PtaU1.Bin050]|nr:MAG: photosystem I assembly protein Ycf3 [Syntrophorhabdus sp. PtaU1.Bin050]
MQYKITKDLAAFQIANVTIRKNEFYRGLYGNLIHSSELSSKLFDVAFPEHNRAFCNRLADCYRLITPIGITTAQEKISQNYKYIFHLCSEGLNLLMAAYISLRNGDRIGSVVILRQALECLSLALALWKDSDKVMPTFERGKFSGEKAIGIAKKLVPFIGKLYGTFSNEFAHPSIRFIGKSTYFEDRLFANRQRILIGPSFHPEHHEEFAQILSYAQLMGMTYHAGIELMFWDFLYGPPHFWGEVGKQESRSRGQFQISMAEQKYMEKYVDGPLLSYTIENLKTWMPDYPLIKEAYDALKKEGAYFLTDLDKLTKVMKKNPYVVFLKYLVAEVAEKNGDSVLAFESLKQYLVVPDVPPFEAYFILGRILENRGETDKAIKSYRKHLKSHPQSYHVLNNLGLIYDKIGQYDKAIGCFRRAQDIKQNYYNGAFNEGNAWLHKKKWGPALEAYKRASQYNKSTAEPLHNMGIVYIRMGNDDKAYSFFRKAVLKDRGYLASWVNLGSINLKQEKLGRAAQCLQRAFILDPANLIVNINLSTLYEKQGDRERAIHYAELACHFNPNSEEAKKHLRNLLKRFEPFSCPFKPQR